MANGSVFLSRDVLRVIEQHGPENIQPRYAVIFRGEKPVAVVAAQIVTVTSAQLKSEPQPGKAHSSSGRLGRVFAPAMNVLTANVRERMLVAGNLLSWGFHGIGFSPEEDPVQIWPGVAEALYRIRRAERLTGQTNFAMVKDVTSSQTGLEALHRFSYYIGFDRAAAAEGLPIYLRLLHATVANAIDWGCTRLSLGRAALEPKAALGAKPEGMSVWLRHRVPALNWVLRGLLGGIPHAEAPERNPFKSTMNVAGATDTIRAG